MASRANTSHAHITFLWRQEQPGGEGKTAPWVNKISHRLQPRVQGGWCSPRGWASSHVYRRRVRQHACDMALFQPRIFVSSKDSVGVLSRHVGSAPFTHFRHVMQESTDRCTGASQASGRGRGAAWKHCLGGRWSTALRIRGQSHQTAFVQPTVGAQFLAMLGWQKARAPKGD